MTALRVAFAGLAHSHPFSDASGLEAERARGASVEFVGVYDADATRSAEFSGRFSCPVATSLDDLAARDPDLVIATPRPNETSHFVESLLRSTSAPLFFNKVVAANEDQLAEWQESVGAAPERVGTSSVLRFAPAVLELAERVSDAEIWGVRALAQHDIGMFVTADRAWQDEPAVGGGTLVTVGLHAWEMVGRVLPGAALQDDVAGWTHRSPAARTRSEETAQVGGTLRLPDGARVPCDVFVSGSPGPEVYALDVFTASGVHSVRLSSADAHRSLGYAELVADLLRAARQGRVAAPWSSARPVVTNTIRAARTLRAHPRTGKSQNHV